MRTPGLGSGFTVFVLFFGLPLLDAVRSHDLLRVTFWGAFALALTAIV